MIDPPPRANTPSSHNVPVGSVIAFAGDLDGTPNVNKNLEYIWSLGWLVCDGSARSIFEYPDLFSVLNFRYGKSGEDKFLLPNYPAQALRGLDNRENASEAGGQEATTERSATSDAATSMPVYWIIKFRN